MTLTDVATGAPLTFEQFCVIAQLEPQEVEKLAPFAGEGERPLRSWVQLIADILGQREPRYPFTPPTTTLTIPTPGPAGDVLTSNGSNWVSSAPTSTGGGTGQLPVRANTTALTASGLSNGDRVMLREFQIGTGLGGGELLWDAYSTAPVDGGGVFTASDGVAGRFHRVAHLLGTFTPEDFGAVGDGVTDDYPAWMNLTAAVTRRGSGTVLGRQDAVYQYGPYIDVNRTNGQPSDPWRDIPTFRAFKALRVDLQGATIRAAGNGHRTMGKKLFTGAENIEWWDSPIDNVSGLTFAYGKNLTLENFNLDGNARTWTRWGIPPVSYRADGYPQGGAHLNEPYHQGLNLWGVDDFTIKNGKITDFMTDGIFLSHSEVYDARGAPHRVTNDTRTLCHRGVLLNVDSHGNRRQGMSIVGGRQITAINCKFRDTGHTGAIDPVTGRYIEDAYGWHEPGAGVDIEPSTYPNHPNANWRVPETTGDISFLNCQMTNNMNSPFVATYSAKIHGNINLKGCLLDGRHDWFPDSYFIMAPGVTVDDCEIYLPPNGFLWQDHDAHKVPANLNARVLNSRIHITRELGFTNANRPMPITIEGNRIYYPEVGTDGVCPIYFLDRNPAPGGAWNIGGLNGVRYANNHHYVPYSYRSNDSYGDGVAQFESVGYLGGNVWEITGTRPAGLSVNWSYQVLYQTKLGPSPAGEVYVTEPQGERYVTPPGAPNNGGTDWLISTPSGLLWRKTYTFKPPTQSYIPFGLSGEIPKGTTELTIGAVRGQLKVTDIKAFWGDLLQPGVTAKIHVLVNDVEKATAQWVAGEDYASVKTGLPFTIGVEAYDQSVRIRLEYTGTATTYEMSNLKGYLATEEIES